VGLDVREGAATDLDALHAVDLDNAADVAQLARSEPPRFVIHLAGLMPPAGEDAMWRANVGGTVGLLTGLRDAGCHDVRIVSIGSAAEYAPGPPGPLREDAPSGGASPYGRTKLAQSLLCLQLAADYGCSAVVARTFNLIGPHLSPHLVAGSLVRQFAAAGPTGTVRIGNAHTARDFVDVRDAVRAYWLLAVNEAAHGIYNVCSGCAISIGQLLDVLARVCGHTPAVERDPARVRASDPIEVVGDPGRLRQTTGWHPQITVEQSLRDMLAHA
jgi:GDP-4-dehydro-6-deoxy-D-mannose reductase